MILDDEPELAAPMLSTRHAELEDATSIASHVLAVLGGMVPHGSQCKFCWADPLAHYLFDLAFVRRWRILQSRSCGGDQIVGKKWVQRLIHRLVPELPSSSTRPADLSCPAARCTPAAKGRVFFAGCYVRYSTSQFWNVYAVAAYSDSLKRFQHALEACGVNRTLIKRGVKEGDTVIIGEEDASNWREDFVLATRSDHDWLKESTEERYFGSVSSESW
ncbi:hypothetical protein PR202_gb11785 [Eleusine coracana subsp. coracana]|uniref:OCT domain-containing protein n=1 Tax=Eleusine coracana subsp. coracana TaxID=191504 RepID=A0AAV5ENP8_ELECO|nr:hypothetical protein PR202_gb11785 [Eleusine coracana subsp. coracana]